ncbi:aspartate/glutamate racemase family protein [Metabacillus litoralis]|uniref:aspartate/glutamate racemase family protein n=1 Tax=Metabacillus litoralis TaxID=152268 RepID=UPI001CFE52D6|nr:amino acid racemase [Metabacillus litoralis]
MQKLGIVGGMGPESTVDYYQTIISKYQKMIGSKEELPEFFINSINMYKMFNLLTIGQTQELINYLVDAVEKLESVGADFVIMAANTPHIVFDEVQKIVRVPMISIVEETFLKTQELGLDKIGLIGTKFTMENNFFKKPFTSNKKEIIVPSLSEQDYIHRKIVEELENGIVNYETKKAFLNIINGMINRDNIEGVILGCTELPILINSDDLTIHQLNTTEIHINKIITTILQKKPLRVE